MADAPPDPDVVDIVLISGDLMTSRESVPESFGYMVRGLIAQERNLKSIYVVDDRADFFAKLRRIAATGKRIRHLVIAGHGNEDHCLIFDDDIHGSAAPLTKRDLSIGYVRARLDEELEKQADQEKTLADLARSLAEAPDEATRLELTNQQTEETERLSRIRAGIARLKQKHEDILSVADVMAPDAKIVMLNCYAGDPDPEDEEPEDVNSEAEYVAATTTFLRSMGECLLQKRGGGIVGPSGVLWTTFHGDFAEDWLTQTPIGIFILALFMKLQELLGGAGAGQFIGFPAKGWVVDQIEPKADALPIGSLLVAGDTVVVPASGNPTEIAEPLMTGQASFKAAGWGPVGSTGEYPLPVECGQAYASGAGTLRLHMRVSPPNPEDMTVSNTNATLDLALSRRGGNCNLSSGSWLGREMTRDFPISFDWDIKARLNPPLSTGVFGGRYPAQSASFSLEFISGGLVGSGAVLRLGSRITTEAARALVKFGDGFAASFASIRASWSCRWPTGRCALSWSAAACISSVIRRNPGRPTIFGSTTVS